MVTALNLLFVAGLAAVAYGCGQLHPALWWIVGGVELAVCAYYAMRWHVTSKVKA